MVFRGLPPEQYKLYVRRGAFPLAPPEETNFPWAQRSLDVVAGSDTNLGPIALDQPSIDLTGKINKGSQVKITALPQDPWLREAHEVGDQATPLALLWTEGARKGGRYTVHGMVPGTYSVLHTTAYRDRGDKGTAHGANVATTVHAVTVAGPTTVDFVAPKGATVRGRMEYASNGLPVIAPIGYRVHDSGPQSWLFPTVSGKQKFGKGFRVERLHKGAAVGRLLDLDALYAEHPDTLIPDTLVSSARLAEAGTPYWLTAKAKRFTLKGKQVLDLGVIKVLLRGSGRERMSAGRRGRRTPPRSPRPCLPRRPGAARAGRSAGSSPRSSRACRSTISSAVAASLTSATLHTRPGRAQGEQRGREAEQLVRADRGQHPGLAGRQHHPVRRHLQPLEVVDGQRAVGELERGEERAVRAEPAVRRDVREPRAVERGQRRLDGGGLPGSGGRRPAAAARAPGPRRRRCRARARPAARPPAVRGQASRARSHCAADGTTRTRRPASAGSIAHGTPCSRAVGTTTTGPSGSRRTASPSSTCSSRSRRRRPARRAGRGRCGAGGSAPTPSAPVRRPSYRRRAAAPGRRARPGRADRRRRRPARPGSRPRPSRRARRRRAARAPRRRRRAGGARPGPCARAGCAPSPGPRSARPRRGPGQPPGGVPQRCQRLDRPGLARRDRSLCQRRAAPPLAPAQEVARRLRAACRSARAASSVPCPVASARSSVLPSSRRWSSRASSPRPQARSTPPRSPTSSRSRPARANHWHAPGPSRGCGTSRPGARRSAAVLRRGRGAPRRSAPPAPRPRSSACSDVATSCGLGGQAPAPPAAPAPGRGRRPAGPASRTDVAEPAQGVARRCRLSSRYVQVALVEPAPWPPSARGIARS